MNKGIPDIGQNIPDFEAVTSDNRIFKLTEELKSGKNIKLAFLEQLHKDSGHTSKARPKKAWVIPSTKDNWRISMNMISVGNFSDWKNMFLLPVNYSKILVSKIKKR